MTSRGGVAVPAGRQPAQGADGEPVARVSGLVVEIPGRRIADGLDLEVAAGEAVAVMGPSGSGKTTLLNTLAGLNRPAAGVVEICGRSLHDATQDAAARLRLTRIGMVFQFGELMPELSVLENVALPAMFAGQENAAARAGELLDLVGLPGYGDRAPEELSGGEAQRAAIARALVCRPQLVLADEPTGALDETNAQRVTRVLLDACREGGAALVVATHDTAVARAMNRTMLLRSGRLHATTAGAGEPGAAS
ncbi:ABC transporter ATP-binding protein [Streptomyces aidingensis]|uniref:Putative ABC transport system ATP-binding protein n=1 Tax=Streptomyces aidingensis TaxID=910347 RepID=A0A1I1TWZ8_9ACTN|nr:ABC transporter ATP-binding protein [Streptomyces aidingensis]SFD62895.1 putative ABC transport system ATP-binding protein [Streptomyces aidingensis]